MSIYGPEPPEAELATGPDNHALKARLDAQVGLRVLKAGDTMKQPTAPPSGIPLYPELPITDDGTAGVSTSATSGGNVNVASQQQDQYFRLQEISRLRKHLEDEKDKRSQLYKKYRRGINVVDAVDAALISASMGMGIGGVGLLTTVIAAPVVLGLEIAALGCGLLGVAGKFIGRRLSVKAKKHDEVRVLAESKLNTIADHVSRALTDGQGWGAVSYSSLSITQMKIYSTRYLHFVIILLDLSS